MLPLFLLLTLGVVDMARIFSTYIALINGVREAALYAAAGTNNTRWCSIPPADSIKCPFGSNPGHEFADPDNIAYQIKIEATGLDASKITMKAPVCNPNPCAPLSKVKIDASYQTPVLTPILSNILGGRITMSASTTATVLR